MRAGDCVEEGRHREVEVVLEPRRAADVLHEVDAAGLQRAVEAADQARRVLLVVHRVERGDEVEPVNVSS
jgi:phage head maturation protease